MFWIAELNEKGKDNGPRPKHNIHIYSAMRVAGASVLGDLELAPGTPS